MGKDKTKQRGQYAFVIGQLTSRELKRKYARSYLGVLWSVLNPLLSMAVLSLIFSHLFRRSIENYPIYYLSGYILWQTFTGATVAAMTTLADNKTLLLRVRFPIGLFVLARVCTAMVNLGYSLIAYAVMLTVFRVPLRPAALFSAVVVLCLFLFSLGVSYLLAAAYVFFGDIRHLYTVFLTLWMYCSAVFYPVSQLQGPIRTLVENNPIFLFIDCLRTSVMLARLPDPGQIAKMLVWSIGMLLLGGFVFLKSKNGIMQQI